MVCLHSGTSHHGQIYYLAYSLDIHRPPTSTGIMHVQWLPTTPDRIDLAFSGYFKLL
jgi:hypothetical protein